MKLPRDISGEALVKLLQRFDYSITRQKGSHIRITTQQNGEHHITIPNHDPIKLGTLASIITQVGLHFNKTKEEIAKELF